MTKLNSTKIENNTNVHLELIFADEIGIDLKNKLQLTPNNESIIINNQKIQKLLNLIHNYFPIKNINSDLLIKEIYILYVFSYLLHNINTKLKLEESRFLELIYYPNLIYVMAYYLKKASKFFQQTIRSVYKESEKKLDRTLMFCITFYNSEFIVIKNDIINIFLNNVIFDANPLEIEDYKTYYYSIFQHIFYLYLERQSSGIIDQEIQVSLGQDLTLSSRFNIYKNGIKITQIQAMCYESATLKKIYSNFNKVKTDIISNELQKLYSIVVDKNEVVDNKMMILKFNMENERLVDIQEKFPLVYKLLRSVKIQSENSVYTHYDKVMIRDTLKTSIYNKLKTHLNDTHAKLLSDAISMKLQFSITEGKYLDPYTLTTLEVRGASFLKQLSSFISLILENIESPEELDIDINT